MKIILAVGDADWQGLYVNGELVAQGHSVTLDDLAEAIISRLPRLDITYDRKWYDSEWIDTRGDLPNDIEEVVFEND